MSDWPAIAEPELLERLAMDDRRFEEFLLELGAKFPAREYEPGALERALGYPWVRPPGSYRLTPEGVELLAEMPVEERESAIGSFSSERSGRLPVIAIGSNAAPETLQLKFAHFAAEEDRSVLALTGRLHDFDVGVAAQPAVYGALPATLFPSPGTEVSTTLLWVTLDQFTQLAWSELSYRLGRLETRFEADETEAGFGEVLVFVSRFGTFCPAGQPAALAAIPAGGRAAPAMTQEELLDAAAAMALGSEATAETLVRGVYEDLQGTNVKVAATVRKASLPFASERWTPFTPAKAA